MSFAAFVRFAVFFLAASSSLVSLAGPPEDADAAYKSGDYATAYRLWNDLAAQGDAAAQNRLGVMYSLGRGVRAGGAGHVARACDPQSCVASGGVRRKRRDWP